MPSLFQRYGNWYGIFTENYRQKWIKIGKMSKTAAKEVLRLLEQDYNKKKFGIVDEKQITFSKYAQEYLQYSKVNKALRTYERDVTSLKNIQRFFHSVYLPRITSHQIEQFKIKRSNERISPRTVNIELRCLSHMLNQAVEWKYIRESPFKGVKLLKHDKKAPRFLTKEEVKILMKTASPWLKPIITVMLNTGIREGERKSLKFEDIDFENKKILIKTSKSKKFRPIRINNKAKKALRWLQKNYVSYNSNKAVARKEHQKEYVFCSEDGLPIKSIKTAFNNACKKADLKDVTPHTLRHTFASHMVMIGTDLRTVQRLLGHRDITTTMIYAHLTEDHLARAVEKLKW